MVTYTYINASHVQDELNKQKPRIEIPALGSSSRDEQMSREDAIRAIESKLRALERNGEEELELNLLNSASTQVPFIQRYQFNKDRDVSSSTSGGRTYTKPYNSAPYNRHQRPKRRQKLETTGGIDKFCLVFILYRGTMYLDFHQFHQVFIIVFICALSIRILIKYCVQRLKPNKVIYL